MEVLCVFVIGREMEEKTPGLNTYVLHPFGSLFPCTVVLLGGR